MEGFKEFQGKDLDDAISAACAYYDAPRERLEIDIIQDSKSGIFGIVGARKARIKARRVQWRDAVGEILGRTTSPRAAEGEPEPRPAPEGKTPRTPEKRESRTPPDRKPAQEQRERSVENGTERRREKRENGVPAAEKPAPAAEKPIPAPSPEESAPAAESAPVAASPEASPRRRGRPRPAAEEERPPRAPRGRGESREARVPRNQGGGQEAPLPPLDGDGVADEGFNDDLAEIPFEQLDQERLQALSLEVVERLAEPIVGKIPLRVALQEGRVNVALDCGDDSGLLIGREGQTLASLQYLASRMVSRGMNAAVRVQLDAGEYRLRQDEKLREIACILADKVRATGKSHSTRPLSSYHRRIIHMTLQDAPDVQTRSSGDGPLKRVVIQRKKG